MRIDPKLLIPIKLEDFRPDGHFYLEERTGEYTRVSFSESEMDDRQRASRIWCWMQENKHRLWLNRNKPWASFVR